MSRGASCPDEPPIQADQPHTRRTASCLNTDPTGRIAGARQIAKTCKTLSVMHDSG